MTALYVLTKILTFPGALTRGFWEQVVCRCSKVPVEDNRYLRCDEMASHIEHEFMPKARGAFAIGFVPFFFQLFGALIIGSIPFASVLYYKFQGNVLYTIVMALGCWVSASLLCNLFPLIEDMLNMTEKVYKHGNVLQKILYTPGIAVLYVGAYLEKYCVTFFAVVAGIVIMLVA